MTNIELLQNALTAALADDDFMGDNKKVRNAIDALTPKDTLTAVLKRLQGNARKEYLVDKEDGKAGDTPQAKAVYIRKYVEVRYNKYMTDPKTADKATKLFNEAYPAEQHAPAMDEAA